MSGRLTLLGSLVVRDLRLFISDRRAAVLCFLVPILLGTLFGLVFDNPARKMGKLRLPLLIVNHDNDPFTQQLVDDLLNSTDLEARLATRDEAERELEKRRVGVALQLPEGFGTAARGQFRQGGRPGVTLLHHPLSAMESEWAEGLLTEILLKRLARELLEPMGLPVGLEKPFHLTRETIPAQQGSGFNSYSHSFAGMVLQYLLFWGMETGLLFLRERRRGIWNRMRIAPVPLSLMLFSRVASSSLIAVLQIAATFLFAWVAFGVEVTGSGLGFVLLALAVSCFASATGLLVATMSGNEARARNICILFILVFSMLGGLWLPTFLLPHWVQELSWCLPTTWAMRGLDGLTWGGYTLSQSLPSCGVVFAFSLTALGMAWIRFARMERRSRRGDTV